MLIGDDRVDVKLPAGLYHVWVEFDVYDEVVAIAISSHGDWIVSSFPILRCLWHVQTLVLATYSTLSIRIPSAEFWSTFLMISYAPRPSVPFGAHRCQTIATIREGAR